MIGGPTPEPQDVQATFCATLVDEWVSAGVAHAVIAPGSRSTPMALAIAGRSDVLVHVVHDERSAAFVALGLGLDGVPAMLLCTSGTAAANFFPAVVEAGLSEVPMLVLTADRPEELRGVGAPQTIDQIDLYGRHVVWSTDVEVPAEAGRSGWRPLAREAFDRAARGPVHLNLPFREPLVGVIGELPAPESARRAHTSEEMAGGDPVPEGIDRQRGVILAGGRSGVAPDAVAALHARTEWPILADPTSGMRELDGVVTTADTLLRHRRFADDHAPEVVVRIGRAAASRLLAEWTARYAGQMQLALVPDPVKMYAKLVGIDRRFAVLATIEAVRGYASQHAGRLPDRLEQLVDTPALTDPISLQPFQYSAARKVN